MQGSILTIGKEILIGQTVDTNSAWLGSQLESIGIEVMEIRTIDDDIEKIKSTLSELYSKTDLIIATGGLGPTNDDITKKALAEFLEVEMEFDEVLYERIQKIFNKRKLELSESIREQCFMPIGVKKLFNRMGTAPGMWFEKNGKYLISMPGVPYEMKWIFENEAIPLLREKLPLKKIYHRTIMTAGMGESMIANKIKHIEESLPSHVSLAYLPNIQQVKLRLSASGSDMDTLKAEIDPIVKQIVDELGSLVYGYDDIALEEALQNLYISKNKTLAAAESCTGGMLSHKITLIPGCSTYFVGGLTVYSNELKMNQLGVSKDTLDEHGAVSEEVVIEMLKGLLLKTQADIGVSISGVAGPSGGSYNKPVGTVWLAYGSLDSINTSKLQLVKDRKINIEYSVNYALNELRKLLLE